MNRFYKKVNVETSPEDQAAFQIHLDGRPVKLMETKEVLELSSERVANVIAKEWDAQEIEIIPDTMPIMQIVSTCKERVAIQRSAIHDQLMKYIDTDLLFYWTDDPKDIAEVQPKAYGGVIDMFKKRYDVDIKTTTGIVALKQDKKLHEIIANIAYDYDDNAFTVFQIVVPILGSVITGILFMYGDLSPEEALSIARVEERFKDGVFNADKYGQDPSIEKSDKAALRDLQACREYLTLIA